VSLAFDDLVGRNVALVMVSATLGPDTRTGTRIDVNVASSGDASSLEGGYLLLTPLMGPDGQVYAVAEGPMVVGGYRASSLGSGVRKNTPTAGQAINAAIVEREVASAIDLSAAESVEFALSRPDFTTASRLAEAINQALGTPAARAISASTVTIAVPAEYRGRFPDFAAQVEAVEIAVDSPARVVVSERTGTVVMGGDVTIAPVAVAHGGLTIEVRRRVDVSQPPPFSGGDTIAQPNADLGVVEAPGRLVVVEGTTIGDLVGALNAMGVTPRDLVILLQAIRTAGAMQAEIVVL
jgi:flagellar P-ring protein precursor FlgI